MKRMLEDMVSNPLFYAATIASLFGLALHYLYYEGFIEENYREAKWFRRLFLPHITFLLHELDSEFDDYDLSKMYVETTVSESEHVLDIDISDADKEEVLDGIESHLLASHYRPEVILSSLASTPDGYKEIGNWVLTAPEKNHTDLPAMGILHDALLMIGSKWQLHVRIFHNEEREMIEFYTHYEKNPYNPFHAPDHFKANGLDAERGKKLFRRKLAELHEKGLEGLNYEVKYD